jgi:hypothetical protein
MKAVAAQGMPYGLAEAEDARPEIEEPARRLKK